MRILMRIKFTGFQALQMGLNLIKRLVDCENGPSRNQLFHQPTLSATM
jgi:hypothetical protein